MNLIMFTQQAYECLKNDVENNRENYYSSEEWLNDYFADKGITEYVVESSTTVDELTLIQSEDDEDKNSCDLQNTMLLYKAYQKLSPTIACDYRVWTALSHITYREYILQRWKKESSEINIEKRFFATRGRDSLCYYNGIARLWWSGYLTYDEDNKKNNPWHLTKVLFSAQQVQKDLFDQPFSMNRKIVKGLLSALSKVQDRKGDSCTKVFRNCCNSYLNHEGVVTILDTLSVDEIENLSYEYMLSEVVNK